mmetsp:Transcript_25013/g.31265  ORF Transcript_25013/g.31265 Transcript_25013/m.31265 type:complete len:136 (+) Transcript_25013:894-1301(+)
MQLQELLSNMVLFSQSTQLYGELFEVALKALGALRRINIDYKVGSYQIEAKDFINGAVSQTLDLRGPVQHWSKRILSLARNQTETIPLAGRTEQERIKAQQAVFCVISNAAWLFTTEAKQRILKEFIKVDKTMNA